MSSSRVVLQILERYSTDKEYELQKSHDKQHQFHTLRYDFKPASVNSDEPASLELSSKGEVTIKAPNIHGSSSSHTVFKGQRRPHVKECLLVIDNRTGEMVLQKLTDNITVKATRTLGNGATSSTNNVPSNTGPPNSNNVNNSNNNSGGGSSNSSSSSGSKLNNSTNINTHNISHGNSNSVINNHGGNNNHNFSATINNHANASNTDGPQLSEDSSSSSDDDSSDSGSSSSSSSSDSESSGPSNDEGFTF